MANKRTYSEILASLETHIIYINNHLGNIDGHLEKLNTTENKQNVAIAKNKTSIGLMWKIGGGLFTLFVIGISIILKLNGVY